MPMMMVMMMVENMVMLAMMFVLGLSGSSTQSQAYGQSRCENNFTHKALL